MMEAQKRAIAWIVRQFEKKKVTHKLVGEAFGVDRVRVTQLKGEYADDPLDDGVVLFVRDGDGAIPNPADYDTRRDRMEAVIAYLYRRGEFSLAQRWEAEITRLEADGEALRRERAIVEKALSLVERLWGRDKREELVAAWDD